MLSWDKIDEQYSKCGAMIALYTFIRCSTDNFLLILAKKPIFLAIFLHMYSLRLFIFKFQSIMTRKYLIVYVLSIGSPFILIFTLNSSFSLFDISSQ